MRLVCTFHGEKSYVKLWHVRGEGVYFVDGPCPPVRFERMCDAVAYARNVAGLSKFSHAFEEILKRIGL